MKTHEKGTTTLALLLWAIVAASTLLPFKQARDLFEPASVLVFHGRNLWEVSAWGVAILLVPVLYIWLLLAPITPQNRSLLIFPLSIYQFTALSEATKDLQTWAGTRYDLFTEHELGYVLYTAFSIPAFVFTLTAIHSQHRSKETPHLTAHPLARP